MTTTCFNCSSSIELNEKIFFCPFCVIQIKCKGCNEVLIKGALGCGYCGSLLIVSKSQQPQLNEIEFEQKGDVKKFKAIFTDNVGHELVSTFGGMVGMNPLKKKPFALPTFKANINSQVISGVDNDIEDAVELDDDNLTEALDAIFKIDGDGLVFQTVNFKSKSTITKEIRISLLSLLGYKYLHNAEEIKRSKITEMLVRFKLNTSNFRAWINKSEEIGQKSGGMIFLTPNGFTTAVNVLKEVLDPNVTDGMNDFSRSRARKKKNAGDNGGETKRSSTKSPKEYISKLLEENFFENKRSVSDIVEHLKINHATIFQTTPLSTVVSRLVGEKKLKREKGEAGAYVYFI